MNRKIKSLLLNHRRPFIVATHLGLIAGSYYLAFLMRFDFSLLPKHQHVFLKTLPVVLIVKALSFYFFDLYRGLWRYVGINDLWQIIKASAASTAVFIMVHVFAFGLTGFPRSVFLGDFIIFTFLASGVRLATRLIKERHRNVSVPKNRARVLIVGAGEAGVLTLREYMNNPAMGRVVGFVDDDKTLHNRLIRNVPVLGDRSKIFSLVESFGIQEIVLAIPSASGSVIRDLVDRCRGTRAKVKIIPEINRILSGALEVKPRDIKPEDLLGRTQVAIDKGGIESYLKGKRVLVTGAGGSIGSELCRQIAGFSPEKLILFDHNENDVYFLEMEFKMKFPRVKFRTIIGDIRDVGLLRQVFTEKKPNVVFHAAAHKHVPLMEENPLAAVKNNVIGTRNLIYAAAHYAIDRFVLISTDKAVNPTSVMGATKRIAEMLLQAKARNNKTKFMAVRFGNVIGSDGSVVPLFKKQIEGGGPVTVTGPDVKRYFMSIPESASLVLQAGALGQGGEIFILDMGEQIRVVDLAKNMIALSGLVLDKDIEIKFIGLRPGEKPYEEMLHNSETDTITKHDKIFVARCPDYDPVKLRKTIRDMERMVKLADETGVMRMIAELVTTYKPFKNRPTE